MLIITKQGAVHFRTLADGFPDADIWMCLIYKQDWEVLDEAEREACLRYLGHRVGTSGFVAIVDEMITWHENLTSVDENDPPETSPFHEVFKPVRFRSALDKGSTV